MGWQPLDDPRFDGMQIKRLRSGVVVRCTCYIGTGRTCGTIKRWQILTPTLSEAREALIAHRCLYSTAEEGQRDRGARARAARETAEWLASDGG